MRHEHVFLIDGVTVESVTDSAGLYWYVFGYLIRYDGENSNDWLVFEPGISPAESRTGKSEVLERSEDPTDLVRLVAEIQADLEADRASVSEGELVADLVDALFVRPKRNYR